MTTSLAERARELARSGRLSALELLHRSGGGHYGGVLSVIDALAALYTAAPIRPLAGDGDRLILSKGHAAAALYVTLGRLGWLEYELHGLGMLGGLEGHPDMTSCRAVHFSTGSLGQGLAVGLGMALALRASDHHVWVVVGDGECQEGQIWEAAMLASRLQLAHLHVVVDANGAQECGWSRPGVTAVPLPEAAAKWNAFGWRVTELPGHDHDALTSWIVRARATEGAPSVALARTIKGHGVRLFQDDPARAHHTQLDDSEYLRAFEELGAC
jgi:transketolase